MTKSVSLWARDGKYIDAELHPDGTLQIKGQILTDDDEYEYVLTVEASDVRTVVAALGGENADPVLPLLSANADMIVAAGPSAWLESIGVEAELWNRMG